MDLHRVVDWSRRRYYRRLSVPISGGPLLLQPVQFAGAGTISIGRDVVFGWPKSPGFTSGAGYIEARAARARVHIGQHCRFNNGVTIISEFTEVVIGDRCLIGYGVGIVDSDGHPLDPLRRLEAPEAEAVHIGTNVLIGSGAVILKGVTIGSDAVIGAGAVVTRDVPASTIAAGNPARFVRAI